MKPLEALQSVQFVTIQGKRFAVVSIEDWDMVLAWLETIAVAEVLPPEHQETALEVLRKRQLDLQKWEIAQDARDSLAAFRAGKLKSQTAEEIISELHGESGDS